MQRLNKEETCDKKRPEFQKLTKPIRSEGKKYQAILKNAMLTDDMMRDMYVVHRQGIELLSKPHVNIDSVPLLSCS